MAFLTVLVVGLVSYIGSGGNTARWYEGDWAVTRDVPAPWYSGPPDPDEQPAVTSGNVPEELVVQKGRLQARSDDAARRYAEQQHAAERDAGANEVSGAEEPRRQFKWPKIPIATDILDLPMAFPTHVQDIFSDLPGMPAVPTDPGDIVDELPTDPGEFMSDLPVPTFPPIPTIPTLPVPVPIPTEIPELPAPTGLPPRAAGLPDITEIPHKVLGVLHQAVGKLSTRADTPRFLRDILRLILRVLNRAGGGDPVPKPRPPTVPTLTRPLPPTVPIPTLPAPTRTRPIFPPPRRPFPRPPRPPPSLPLRSGPPPAEEDGDRAVLREAEKVRGGGDKEGEPLSDEGRKQLRDAVADEVWAAADWSDPLVASATAALAMVTFDAVLLVAERWEGTDDEDEKERLLDSFIVVVDDDDVGVVA